HNIKDPFEITLYPLLLWELKPKTVIEIGSFRGGSALWMADQLQAMGIDSQVYSFDYKPELVQAQHELVTFSYADCNDPQTLDAEKLLALPRPWLVIEDAHVNVEKVLGFLDRLLKPGDYLVVEDVTWWRGKYRQFKRFMEGPGRAYSVDTKYTDMFGYNATFNSNAYLRKN
ncbi:MAG TPA: CmcI family methyltransferase, partial [Bdellovibrionota bacterium]|nr:CmcI family methyltransferase [Bdellovibrionota bacterium]